jgi:hypothetical protein
MIRATLRKIPAGGFRSYGGAGVRHEASRDPEPILFEQGLSRAHAQLDNRPKGGQEHNERAERSRDQPEGLEVLVDHREGGGEQREHQKCKSQYQPPKPGSVPGTERPDREGWRRGAPR